MPADDPSDEEALEPDAVARWQADEHPPQLIDVREDYERAAGHIPDSRHIPLADLTAEAPTLQRDRPIVFYCRSGVRSEMAAAAFRTAGFEAYTMTGGLLRWAREGRPLAPEGATVAEH